MSSIDSPGNGQPRKKSTVYLPQEDLKTKYKMPRIDRIKTYCKSIKSIGLATELRIEVENTHNNTIHITVIAHPQSPQKDFDKAFSYIVGEFVKANCQRKYPDIIGISGPQKVKEPISEEKQKLVQKEGDSCPPLSEEALKKHDLLTSCELRQFRCPKCRSPFWRTVLNHKPVAPCKKCKLCLCPLERSEEFGIGRFICDCGNVFYGRCQATDVRQCKDCLKNVKNPYIHPRFRSPHGPLPPGIRKPTPRRYEQVSQLHDCSGSTISLFVRQWDELPSSESFNISESDFDDDDPPCMPEFDLDLDKTHGSDELEGEESDSEPEAPDRRRRPHNR